MEVQDPQAGEIALAELQGIQFGILSNEDTFALSVFERNQTIDKAKDLWDSRLGVYTLLGKDDRCGTCGAKKASDCDGHFGHINLPMAVYHPLHIRFLKKVLSQICLVCLRYKEKKVSKKVVLCNEETMAEELHRKVGSTLGKLESCYSKNDCEKSGTEPFSLKSEQTHDIQSLKSSSTYRVESLATTLQSLNAINRDATGLIGSLENSTHGIYKAASNIQSTKPLSRLEAAYIASKGLPVVDGSSDDEAPTRVTFQRTSLKVEGSKQIRCPPEQKQVPEGSDTSELSDIKVGCKYCGADLTDPDDRYPDLVVTLSMKKENSYETIEMKACAKEELVPLDFWEFVQGHPGGQKNIRPLVPFEALQILRRLSGEVIHKLGMHERVARPEALILCTLPVPPSGARIRERDSSSSLPTAHMDQQHRLLQRVSAEVKRLHHSRTGKPNFAVVKSEVMELQSLASHYLTGSKWEHGLRPNRLDPEVQKDDKLMKGNVLAKRNNVSARMIVVGDPSIQIEEILVPIDLVEQLTLPERVTAISIGRLQQYVNNGPHADFLKTGAVSYDRPGSLGISLHRTSRRAVLEIGDTVHRHLKDGDLVIVNRPPSLTKHSLMAMRVRLHVSSTFGINPLICAPFQADFDGDAMHVFVPQSPEALAEIQELMNVPNQLMNPQGGQSNIALTEDSRLGAYLITGSCLFLNKIEMSQLTISNCTSLPIPAILKSPTVNGPLWTGQQLYSTTIPGGTNYIMTNKFTMDAKKGILVRDGELLVCDASSHWLEDGQDTLVVVISNTLGPTAAVTYLNDAQELANLYLGGHGFSIGLQDYQLARDRRLRDRMLYRMREELARANREALLKAVISDEQVQRLELHKHPTSRRGFSVDTECSRSKGLYLATDGCWKNVKALEKVAISGFQTRFSQVIGGLAKDYSTKENSLVLMIKAGSKGSMSKLVQQTVSLGLQLYKGEHLLPCSAQGLPCQGQLRNSATLRIIDLLQVEQGAPVANLPGYWESRGVISNSYLDGLRPLQFFTHTIASRYGLQRAGVEEPNLLLRRLLLFMRDLHVGYDGSVCNLQGRHIVQFEYGGLLEVAGEGGLYRSKRGPEDCPEAGEAVGILAATAVTEPAYQLKLDSPHMIGAKAIGPLELMNETLSSSKILKPVDRRILLRMPCGLRSRHHGQEKGATKIQQHLKPITLDMVTLTMMIEYQRVGEIQSESGEERRKSPWVGHIQLSREKLERYQVLVSELVLCLETKYSKQDSHCLFFSSSNKCHLAAFPTNQEEGNPWIHFFPDIPSFIASCNDLEYENYMSAVLETMKEVMLPILLRTTVKGDERILSVNILWEESAWNPTSTKYPPMREVYKQGNGELVLEVNIKEAHCKKRGRAWEIVKEACVPIVRLLDWQRCTPYSIQETNYTLGLEAAHGLLLQRLGLAVAGMGKAVHLEHLKLIADSITICGEVNGACFSGYKGLCKSLPSSTPFSTAVFANPKNMFIQAAREGASEHMGGAIAASVWGKRAPLGTGSSFELLWQEKMGSEPLPKLEKGVDPHQYYAKAVAGERAKSVPVLHYESDVPVPMCPPAPVSKHTRPRMQPIETADYGRKCGRGDSWREYRDSHRRSVTKLRAAGHSRRSRLAADLGQASTGGPNFRRKEDLVTEKQDKHASPSSANHEQVTSHSQARSPVTRPQPPISLPVPVGNPPVDSRTKPEESTSSFHTPNETLEIHSANSSPCSSFRDNLGQPPVRDGRASDQMSSIIQRTFQVLRNEAIATASCARDTDSPKSRDVEASGWVSPFAERSSRRVPNQHLQHTTSMTAELKATDDVLEREKRNLNDEWERLLHLARVVKYILHSKYEIGDRLGATDQRLIVDKVLRFHPDYLLKIGCGVHYIKVDRHKSHLDSRCFYVVRNDQSICDFSYRKCIKGVANAKSPTLALRYDHEVLIRHERDNFFDLDLLYSPDLDPLDFYPSWAPPTRHGQLISDADMPVLPQQSDGGSKLNTLVREAQEKTSPVDDCTSSRPEDEISCDI